LALTFAPKIGQVYLIYSQIESPAFDSRVMINRDSPKDLRFDQPVSLPYPGRRSKKLGKTLLVSALIVLNVLGAIGPQIPNMLGALFPLGPSNPLNTLNTSKRIFDSGPGTPLPPGTVRYDSRAAPTISQLGNESFVPHLITTSRSFYFQTSSGIYSFNRSIPFVFALSSSSARSLAQRVSSL